MDLKIGQIVTHPLCPEWGPGKILLLEDHKARVYFRDVVEVNAGDAVKGLDLRRVTLVPYAGPPDPWLDRLPNLVRNGRIEPLARPRLTFVQALETFLAMFPGGFANPQYILKEDVYKRDAQRALHDLGLHAKPVTATSDFVPGLLKALGKLNLLSLQERLAFKEGLEADASSAAAYREALFDVCSAAGPDRRRFEALSAAVAALPVKPGGHPVKTWPILTLVPFIARPDRQMFVKPVMTQLVAGRLAYDILYSSAFNWPTYERVLEMGALVLEHLRPHGAVDFIDVQSFMWLTTATPTPSKARGPKGALP